MRDQQYLDRTPFAGLDLDPHRLKVALHELGHGIVWSRAGWQTGRLQVTGHGPRTHGYCEVHLRPFNNVADACGYLAGIEAGKLVDLHWMRLYGAFPDRDYEYGWSLDMASLRRHHRRSPMCKQVPFRDHQKLGTQIIKEHWKQILRLAPRLATRGRMSLS